MSRRLVPRLAAVLVAALILAFAELAGGTSSVPSFFQGTFADSRWGGAIGFVVSPDGRTVMSIGGIAPGRCEDEDFGALVAGRDGATGPMFDIFTSATIRADGRFAVSERRAGQRRPFKPAYNVSVSGRFSGDVVRGRLRATMESPFDRCTANVAFTARRGGLLAAGPSQSAGRGRRPPATVSGVQLEGRFPRADWEGYVKISVSESGTTIGQVDGILPGTCQDARTGRRVRAGRDGAIGVTFIAYPNAPIRPNGSFSFTARAGVDSGYAPHTITVRGTFYGSNVLGRVTGKSGKDTRYSNCRGDEPFFGKRTG